MAQNASIDFDNLFSDLTTLPGQDSGSNPPSTVYTATPSDHSSDVISPPSQPQSTRGGARPRKKHQLPEEDEDVETIAKRQRNTMAARKYRQKRLDRIQELEDALAAVKGERDDLKVKLARQEAETAALKEILGMRSK